MVVVRECGIDTKEKKAAFCIYFVKKIKKYRNKIGKIEIPAPKKVRLITSYRRKMTSAAKMHKRRYRDICYHPNRLRLHTFWSITRSTEMESKSGKSKTNEGYAYFSRFTPLPLFLSCVYRSSTRAANNNKNMNWTKEKEEKNNKT